MANPRRNSFQTTQELPIFTNPQIQSRIQQNSQIQPKPIKTNTLLANDDIDQDQEANVIRFKSNFPSKIAKDNRGWLLDPVSIALASGIKGGALVCNSIHVGEIKPGRYRGNHRHHSCNETFLIWGGRTLFRLENKASEKGFARVLVGVEDVAVAVSPAGTAHALINVDETRSTFIIGCQDSVISYDKSSSDFGVWDDLN
ncbi:RmlC-type cupin [Tanacetum coccineum]